MSIPADLVVRVATPHLRRRRSAGLFCFALGFLSAIASLALTSLVLQSPAQFIETFGWADVLSFADFGLPAGILTALASPLIFAPAETPAGTRTVP